MKRQRPKTYSEEVAFAFAKSKLSLKAFVQNLQAEGVTHRRTAIEDWANGKKPPAKSAVPAISKILGLDYKDWRDVEKVYPETEWGQESRASRKLTFALLHKNAGHPRLLHHVSLAVRNLDRSISFYKELLGIEASNKRPGFPFDGAWFELPSGQHLHLVDAPDGTFRESDEINPRDCHFALSVHDYRQAQLWLDAKGIRYEHDRYLLGYLQLYFLDPDRHVIEINSGFETSLPP